MAQQGWYQDPQDPRVLRWWDGSAWTDRTQLAAAARMAHKRTGVWMPLGIAVAIMVAVSAVASLGSSSGRRSPEPSVRAGDEAAPIVSGEHIPTITVERLYDDLTSGDEALVASYRQKRFVLSGVAGHTGYLKGSRVTINGSVNDNVAVAAYTMDKIERGKFVKLLCSGGAEDDDFAGVIARGCELRSAR